jgi:hypothetical protein
MPIDFHGPSLGQFKHGTSAFDCLPLVTGERLMDDA